ncbi:hypothetical protein QF046_001872 [Microbacterium sp. W4I4]|nr:hypothetical protein [Microbacterium sp. W4I4]
MPPAHESRIMSSTDTSARSAAPIQIHPTTDPTDAPVLAWSQADEDVFVATNAGEFAGFVTVDRNAHIVHDNHSRRIGSFSTLAAARQALVDATRPPSRRRERLRTRILSRRR